MLFFCKNKDGRRVQASQLAYLKAMQLWNRKFNSAVLSDLPLRQFLSLKAGSSIGVCIKWTKERVKKWRYGQKLFWQRKINVFPNNDWKRPLSSWHNVLKKDPMPTGLEWYIAIHLLILIFKKRALQWIKRPDSMVLKWMWNRDTVPMGINQLLDSCWV